MDKNYNFKNVEDRIYNLWLDSGCFKANPSSQKPPFSIVLPPPNANADLHLGHAMNCIEDVLIRYKKMSGFETLWVPGADHGGFETQVVYEKALSKEGKSRFDFSREDLYENIMSFVLNNKSRIQTQLQKLGFSLDWSRDIFTLDEKVIKTVYETFEKLYNDDLIYRGERLVNYCTKHNTGFSDLEINYIEKNEKLYFVKYNIENSSNFLTVATVRPETIFVDCALAVNPNDERYREYQGKRVINPLTNELLPIICDEKVEIEFGTGVLKITPMHDFTDYEIAKRHNLVGNSVLNVNGRLNSNALEFEGKKVLEARELVANKLKLSGNLIETKDYTHQVPVCYKCETTIEPMLLPQWFVKTKPLAQKALNALTNGDLNIIPERFEERYTNWLENIIDWNISRQIVWGIRIPAFECQVCKKWQISKDLNPKKCDCGSLEFKQDADTFDTWFSSGQWPFASIGYPDSEYFKKFYPISVMETGADILFFWVSRMVMLGIYVTGKSPFEKVYLHGLVRDSKGQKMSKSKGNVVNPLELIEKYGADTLRFSLMMGVPAGNDQNYSEAKLVGGRNFCNKLWNMSRFLSMTFEQNSLDISSNFEYKDLEKLDSSISQRHLEFINSLSSKMEKYMFSEALEDIHNYIWHEVASSFIEKSKDNPEILPLVNHIFKDCLKVLHPFMPFITEEIWQIHYSKTNTMFLMTEKYPEY
jgi:valyl-tRNA synthetase